ncbi:hypothetical protein LCGC14_0629870 [marine sediment metagenome]|uniref:Uncharacterized protein n=1 Tax=marine sediment metagenome TaxID=412755 RepID=A0A0F9R270_9ZZZZ
MLVAKGKTQSFTREQRREVDEVLSELLGKIRATFKNASERILKMDKRPKMGCTTEEPDVFFPYVKQAMLEDLIVELEARV